jgi:hypothetical protein
MESNFEYCIVNFICTKMCKDTQLAMSITKAMRELVCAALDLMHVNT